jgi:glycosyltransferase involved in cell wall biosynthesis
MRIAMVTPRYGGAPGGLGRHVQELARHVAAAGHSVEVLTHGRGPAGASPWPGGDVTVRRFRSPVAGAEHAVSAELWAYLRRNGRRYDVVHGHGYRTLPALLAARAELPPVALTPHLHRAAATRVGRVVHPVYRRLGAPAIARADVVICVSRAEAERVAGLAPSAAGRTHVVPDGVDVAAIAAAVPVDPPRIGRLILGVGRPVSCAGADRLISALPALPDGFALAIAADGPAVGALRAHAVDLAVARRVRFLGRLDEPAYHRWLRTADVVASMAAGATSATALLEARAAGAPVVASDVDVHREADELLGGGLHLVSPQASPLALADVLAAVVSAPAPAPAAAIPTWATVADLTLGVYARCLEAAAAERPAPALQWGVA